MTVPPTIAEEKKRHARRKQSAYGVALPIACLGLAGLTWIGGRIGSVNALLWPMMLNMLLGLATLWMLVFSRPFVWWQKVLCLVSLASIIWFCAGGLDRIGLAGFCTRLDANASAEQLRSWAESIAATAPSDRLIEIEKDRIPAFVSKMMGTNPTVLADKNEVVIINGGRNAIVVRIGLSQNVATFRPVAEVMWKPGILVQLQGS